MEGTEHDELSTGILMINWNVTLCVLKTDFKYLKIAVKKRDVNLSFSLCTKIPLCSEGSVSRQEQMPFLTTETYLFPIEILQSV